MSEPAMLSENLLTAQVGVLGSMLIDADTVGGVLVRVSEKDFSLPQYRTVFTAIRHIFAAGMPVDAVTINETLGGNATQLLIQIMESTPTAANCDSYVDLLKESSLLHALQEIGLQLSSAGSVADCQSLVDAANKQFCSRTGIQTMNMAEGYDDFFNRHNGEKKEKYLSFGMSVLDEYLYAEAGDMLIIGGYPSDGKTALALPFAFHMAKTKRVGYFTYEQNKEKIHDRIICAQALLPMGKIKKNELGEEDYRTLLEMKETLTTPSLTVVQASGMTVLDLRAWSLAHHYDVVFVDYLQKIAPDKSQRDRSSFDAVSRISSDLQEFGRQTDTVVIAVSQLSRAQKTKNGTQQEAPTMASLRQTGQIEQDADIVLLLYREEPEIANSPRLLKVAKNKEGERGLVIKLRFDGSTQSFTRFSSMPEPAAKRVSRDQVTFQELADNRKSPF